MLHSVEGSLQKSFATCGHVTTGYVNTKPGQEDRSSACPFSSMPQENYYEIISIKVTAFAIKLINQEGAHLTFHLSLYGHCLN